MIAYFFFALGAIMLFLAFIEGLARIVDRYADWKDEDTLRRAERLELVRKARAHREYQEWRDPTQWVEI